MIYYLTVHWKSPEWIRIQTDFIRKNTPPPYKVFAFLNGFDATDWEQYFDYTSTEAVTDHAIKLNLLADLAAMDAADDTDILAFIDGDAFPVEPIAPLCENLRADETPLIAVQRLENAGDPQPHPCFCLTTVRFWKQIRGDWKLGPTWKNANGEEVTDVGARLRARLNEQGIDWTPLLRTNTTDLHPLWFAVYGDVVYHHGAGFRPAISRIDYVWARRAAKLLPTPIRKRLSEVFLNAVVRNRQAEPDTSEQITLEDIEGNFRFHDRLTR